MTGGLQGPTSSGPTRRAATLTPRPLSQRERGGRWGPRRDPSAAPPLEGPDDPGGPGHCRCGPGRRRLQSWIPGARCRSDWEPTRHVRRPPEAALDGVRAVPRRGVLTEANIAEGLREVRTALLEADVNYNVVQEFMARVNEQAVGAAVDQGGPARPADRQDRPRRDDRDDGAGRHLDPVREVGPDDPDALRPPGLGQDDHHRQARPAARSRRAASPCSSPPTSSAPPPSSSSRSSASSSTSRSSARRTRTRSRSARTP